MKKKTKSKTSKKFFALEFTNVGPRRGLDTVLHGVSFKIKPSESVAILGPNGSGKTTLMKLLSRELYPTEGRLRLFGRDNWDVFELRSFLGLISNDLQTMFEQDMTGMDAVLSGFFSSVGLWLNHSVTPEMRKKAGQSLRKLGLGYLAERKMNKISSGEARRLLIARALVHDPRTLVFDEPTNSLDLKAQRDLRLKLRILARSGVGIVLATHQLSDIIPEIKRVILLKEGRIAADGPKEKILSTSQLKSVFGVSLDLVKKDGLYHGF